MPLAVIDDTVCTACGCLCDDIGVRVEQNRVVAAENACPRGKEWFLEPRPTPRAVATIEGRPSTVDAAIDRAAEMLARARSPLVYGLSEISTEAQREAIALADKIGATIDTPTSSSQGSIGMAFHGVGEMTCTLGEMRNRADFIIFWGCDPVTSHPRHLERYSLDAPGMFIPSGREGRTCVVVDVERSATAERSDLFLQIRPAVDFEALWTLRALLAGVPLDADAVEAKTGLPLEQWQHLIERMRAAKFGVIVYGGGLARTAGRHLNVEALLALVRDMNAHTRFVAGALRAPGNQVGADCALLWQTGFPFAVNLARGFPRYGPEEFTASQMLARGEVDAALVLGSDPLSDLPEAAAQALRAIPYVCVDHRDTATMRSATVAIRSSTYGIEVAGVAYRMDDVPLPLKQLVMSELPNAVDVLSQIAARVGTACGQHG
jgi:formylmethanofuran dehydrogenase subunit B